MIFYDVWHNKLNEIKVKKNPKCTACNGKYEFITPKESNDLFEIKICKTKAAYAAKPKRHLKMNLEKLKNKYNIKADAGIVLIADIDGEDVIIHSFGEILFKGCKDIKKMHRIAEDIYKVAL